ncbi:hypothetical protein [Leuconostoc mesenteroides]|uniref:hypothetical protein n=1 Tax=Leuconostoc mesenteroides TaxID=1245 RepID=UPI00386771F0
MISSPSIDLSESPFASPDSTSFLGLISGVVFSTVFDPVFESFSQISYVLSNLAFEVLAIA